MSREPPRARARWILPRRLGTSDEGTAEAMGRQLTVEYVSFAKLTLEAEMNGQCIGWMLGYCFRDRGSGDRW
jgi:hypothetical protein